MMIYAVLFLSAFLLTSLFTPVSILLARRMGAIDVPTRRKVHRQPVPRLGGVAIIAAAFCSLTAGALVNPYIRSTMSRELLGMEAGLLILLAVGLWDDTFNLSPLLKLGFQAAAASTAVWMGVHFELASNPLVSEMRDYFNLGWLAFPLSVLWIVALTNAMNLIDGLDGLATGIALFTSLTLFLITINGGAAQAGGVAYFYIVLAGAALGFLRHNRFPAKVFLGDTGSMFLGFTLACLSIQGGQKSFTLSSFLIPAIVFGIPIFDSVLAMTRRYLNRRGIATADREHLHHRLMDLGLNQRQAVLLLYFITVLLGIIAFAFTVQLNEYATVIITTIGVLGAILAKEFNLFGTQRREMERIQFAVRSSQFAVEGRGEWQRSGEGNRTEASIPDSV